MKHVRNVNQLLYCTTEAFHEMTVLLHHFCLPADQIAF